MERYEIIVADRVKAMLGTHIKFLARVSPVAALGTKARILATIRSLNIMPGRYPFFDEDYIPRGKYHKVFVENWYLILFQVRDRVVYVDYIVDCRQDYKWLVR